MGEEWLVGSVTHTNGQLVAQLSNGTAVRMSANKIDLESLRVLAKKASNLFTLEKGVVNQIKASKAVADCLPLLLSAGGGQHPKDDEVPEAYEEIFWAMDNFSGPVGWLIEVNEEPWGSWDDEYFIPADDPRELLSDSWASVGFTETASMTSGYDSASIGAMNKSVGFDLVSMMDEHDPDIRLFAISDPGEQIFDWILDNRYMDEWGRGAEQDPGNGTFINAVIECLINPSEHEYFPGLAVFRHAKGLEQRALPGTPVDGDFEPDDSAEWYVSMPSAQTTVGKKLLKKLLAAYPGLPKYQVIQDVDNDVTIPEKAVTSESKPVSLEDSYEDLTLKLKLAVIDYGIVAGRFGICDERLMSLREDFRYRDSDSAQEQILIRLARLRQAEGRLDEAQRLREKAEEFRSKGGNSWQIHC